MTTAIKNQIFDKARAIGFDQAGFCGPDGKEGMYARYRDFIDKNYHGTMDWMDKRHEHRQSPRHLWPDCQSVLMLAVNYNHDPDPLSYLSQPEKAGISIYARGRDYHDIIKKKLKQLGRWMVDQFDCDIKVFVDTAPVMEKPLASEAGIGWQGKHTNLVSSQLGSWFFLGAIFTTLDLPPDAAHTDHCGSCTACLDICPTKAFPTPYQLDARRCISYLTIEHDGPIPEEFRKPMGNRIYGCDDCLAICPWNKFAQQSHESHFLTRESLKEINLTDIIQFKDDDFRKAFSKSPIKRTGRDKLVRNALYALGNSGQTDALPLIRKLCSDPSAMVVDAANWAIKQLEKG